MTTFVDEVTLHLRAGHGGHGCVSVRREKFKPLAGPDGGNGGHGGDITLVADPQVTTLLNYNRGPHRSSGNGGPGMGDHRSGANGESLELTVPVGTVVHDTNGDVLADLDEPGMRLIVAAGGQGGLGNASLATTKSLSSWINLTVVQGAGGSFGDCDGFVAQATNSAVFSGTVADFGTHTDFAGGVGVWTPDGLGTDSRVYKVTYTVNASAPNSTQGGSATVGFTWEAQNN